MGDTVYDEHVRMYLDFVDGVLASDPSLFRILLDVIEGLLGDRISGARICDVGCGEGYVSRRLAELGAAQVVGIDISSELVAEAGRRSDAPNLTFLVGDARRLDGLESSSFDVAVSQMAMMDIADHRAAFAAIARVVKPDGRFVFSMLHPCFESPFRFPDEQPFLEDEEGRHIAVIVRRYASEGHWRSEGTGVRGHVGSYHRMLSTYLNDLVTAGFRIDRIEEPLAPAVVGLPSQVPRVMVVAATRDGAIETSPRILGP